MMFEAYGIKVSWEQIINISGFLLAFPFHPLSKTVLLSQLSLLKALIDRLLQDKTQDLLKAPVAASKTIGKTEAHTSNIDNEPAVRKPLHRILPTSFFFFFFFFDDVFSNNILPIS